MEVDVVTVGSATKTFQDAIEEDVATTTMGVDSPTNTDIGINNYGELSNVQAE
jgi:hypothetical protein